MPTERQLAVAPTPATKLMRFEDFNKLFERVQKQMERIAQRAFQFFELRGRIEGHDLEDWFKAESELFQPVPVEIEDKGDQLIIRADVPGFNEDELEIGLDGARVVITGKTENKREETEKGQIVYSEHLASEICRCIDLPQQVNPEQACAVLRNGRLEITVAKKQAENFGKKILTKAA